MAQVWTNPWTQVVSSPQECDQLCDAYTPSVSSALPFTEVLFCPSRPCLHQKHALTESTCKAQGTQNGRGDYETYEMRSSP